MLSELCICTRIVTICSASRGSGNSIMMNAFPWDVQSCQIFYRFSTEINWILMKRGATAVSHILDYLIFVGPSDSPCCLQDLDSFFTRSKQLSIPINQKKTCLPATVSDVIFKSLFIKLISVTFWLYRSANQRVFVFRDTQSASAKANALGWKCFKFHESLR